MTLKAPKKKNERREYDQALATNMRKTVAAMCEVVEGWQNKSEAQSERIKMMEERLQGIAEALKIAYIHSPCPLYREAIDSVNAALETSHD